MLSQLPAALCLLLCSAAGTAASSLVLFSDANCQTSQTRLAGENGYPDGYCTNIAEVADATYKSFMFTVLDDGCTRAFLSSTMLFCLRPSSAVWETPRRDVCLANLCL